jgi:predicted ATPase/DNA-binding SARP family transcriptional activator
MLEAFPQIQVLGRLRLIVRGEVIERLPTQRLAALLAYLVLHAGWQTREVVAEATWPELPEGKGLASLRNALSVLRRILEPNGAASGPLLEATRTNVRLSRALCGCDVWTFQDAVERNDLELAVRLYEGDLLPDLRDEWLDPHRETLRRAFTQAISKEAHRALAAGEPELAIRFAERWMSFEPFESQAVKILALGLAGTGHPRAAYAAVDKFIKEDREAFGGEPPLDVLSIRSQIAARAKLASAVSLKDEEPNGHSAVRAAATTVSRTSRLPLYLSRFFGRDLDLERIGAWFDGPSQLLTIVGTGGIGKTRIAIEASRPLASKGRNVSFVPLDAADSDTDLVAALMHAFELRESDTLTPRQVVRSYLVSHGEETVLILDNLEQMVSAAAAIVIELLATNPRLKILCTSRERLGLEGEELLTLAPLDTTIESEKADMPAILSDHAAIEMFIDRARIARADFALTERNHRDVGALCRELDGLPLAIEIMAGWAGTWTVAEMRNRVHDSQVVARRRGHDPRHRSLEACIEWSFDLLEPKARVFLCAMSLFRGGWTLEAAVAVTGTDDAAETLAALVDRSLVSSAEIDVGLRFFMLESVRAYCRSRLTDADATMAAGRFVEYFKDLSLILANPCAGASERTNHRKLDRERENIEVAVSLCEEGLARVDVGLELLGRLHIHWVYRGQERAGMNLIDRLLAVPVDEALGGGRILGLQTLSVLARGTGLFDRAEQALRNLQTAADQQADAELQFRVLTQIGNFHLSLGRYESARDSHAKALEIALHTQVPRMESVGHCNLAQALFGLGQVEGAIRLWRVSAELDRANGNIAGEAMLHLGFAEALTGYPASGAQRIRTYLANAYGLGFARGYSRAVHLAALVAAELGDIQIAVDLVASATAFAERSGFVFDTSERQFAELVDRAIKRDDPSNAPGSSPPMEIAEAVARADRYLAAKQSHGSPRSTDSAT